jgi:hypothetical protein
MKPIGQEAKQHAALLPSGLPIAFTCSEKEGIDVLVNRIQ